MQKFICKILYKNLIQYDALLPEKGETIVLWYNPPDRVVGKVIDIEGGLGAGRGRAYGIEYSGLYHL